MEVQIVFMVYRIYSHISHISHPYYLQKWTKGTLLLPRNFRQGVYVVLDRRQPQHVTISPTTKRLRDIQGCNYFSRGHPEQEIVRSTFLPKSSLYHLRHAVPKLCSLGASKQFRFLHFERRQWRENRAMQLCR